MVRRLNLPRYTEGENLAYLTAIIEGEGCIIFSPQHKGKTGYHQIRINISNTDLGIIDFCCDVLSDLNIRYSRYTQQPRGISKKPLDHIEICRKLECKYLLEKLLPYFHSIKKVKALEVISYIEQNQYDILGRKRNFKKRG